MKNVIRTIVAVLAIAPVVALAYTSPGRPTGFVNDFAGILSVQDKQSIEARLQSLRDSTSAQVAVVTVSSLGGDSVENYAVSLFQDWGIGEKGKDNGLLILVAPNEREVRIEVGYGLEGDITDLQAGLIVRNIIIPAFRDGDYSGGISKAVEAVSAVILKSPEAQAYLENSGSARSSEMGIDPFAFFFFLIIILNVLSRVLGKTKSWWLGGVIGAGIGTVIGLIWGFVSLGIISIVILSILGFIFDYFVSKRGPGTGAGGHGGFWFGPGMGGGRGGFGGGFGGFGGGFSGGGGASGRW